MNRYKYLNGWISPSRKLHLCKGLVLKKKTGLKGCLDFPNKMMLLESYPVEDGTCGWSFKVIEEGKKKLTPTKLHSSHIFDYYEQI